MILDIITLIQTGSRHPPDFQILAARIIVSVKVSLPAPFSRRPLLYHPMPSASLLRRPLPEMRILYVGIEN